MRRNLTPPHKELLYRMFSKGIRGMNYKPIEKIADYCKWADIVSEHGGGTIKTTIRYLAKLGLVNLHGKRGAVASISHDGVMYVRGEFEV